MSKIKIHDVGVYICCGCLYLSFLGVISALSLVSSGGKLLSRFLKVCAFIVPAKSRASDQEKGMR